VTVRIRGRESRDTARWQMDWQPVTLNDGRYVRFIPSGRYRVAVLPRSRGVERTRRLEEVVTCK